MKEGICMTEAKIKDSIEIAEQHAKFNLIDEPWILVRRGSNIEEVSLNAALCKAHEYHALAGELPTQDVAVLRVLLAVLYGTFMRYGLDGELAKIETYQDAINRWKSLRGNGRFPAKPINDYLEKYHRRFWLFTPDKSEPFMQVGIDDIPGDKFKPIAKMIAHVPSRDERMFFTELSGDALQSLTFAQAARWLVHLQAWDYAGKKSPLIGGPNGGGTGWCGKLGIVYPVGASLFETLMLNLVFVDNNQPINFSPPIWESDTPKALAREKVLPKGYVELLTWQSRRVLLRSDGDKVVGVISSYGDVFDKENTIIEMMSGWHISSQKGQGYIPNTHVASKSMWRDLGALLPQADTDDDDGAGNKRPKVLDWLSECDISGNINIHAVGYEYGAMQGIVDELIFDSLAINAQLFADLETNCASDIITLLEKTDEAVNALKVLSFDLARSAVGGGAKSPRDPREQAYFALDGPFRAWLADITPSSDMTETGKQWKNIAKRIIYKAGKELIAEAGNAAFKEREVETKTKKEKIYMNSFVAQAKFEKALRSILGGGR
jgi:CRISPR system Cascade subunit CasA